MDPELQEVEGVLQQKIAAGVLDTFEARMIMLILRDIRRIANALETQNAQRGPVTGR